VIVIKTWTSNLLRITHFWYISYQFAFFEFTFDNYYHKCICFHFLYGRKVHVHVKDTINKTGKTYPLEINVREDRRSNQEWIIQRHCQR